MRKLQLQLWKALALLSKDNTPNCEHSAKNEKGSTKSNNHLRKEKGKQVHMELAWHSSGWSLPARSSHTCSMWVSLAALCVWCEESAGASIKKGTPVYMGWKELGTGGWAPQCTEDCHVTAKRDEPQRWRERQESGVFRFPPKQQHDPSALDKLFI